MVGIRLEPGIGLAGKVLQSGKPMLTNDYLSIAALPSGSPFERYHASLAIPFEWSEELRGIVSVGYARPHHVTQDDLALLETFAELAAAACRNASLHAAIAQEARTDGLTGCLNHAALHESLLREIERAARVAGRDLSLILIDLNDFKQVNEQHGHLIGDEVLRRIGSALRGGTRPYDIAARYGGDEFALLAIEADEEQAAEIARRTIERVGAAAAEFGEVSSGGATAGVAEWVPGLTATQLIARADRALLLRQAAGRPRRGEPLLRAARARVHAPLRVPVRPRSGRRAGRSALARQPATRPASACASARASSPRPTLSAPALSAMTDVQEILDAVVEELHRRVRLLPAAQPSAAPRRPPSRAPPVAATSSSPSPPATGPSPATSASSALPARGPPRRRRRRPPEPDFRPRPRPPSAPSSSSRLCAGELWGVLNVEELAVDAFHEDDVRLMETMADQPGSALRSASLYEQLERAYMGTAEALAAALEAKDSYTANHARSIVEHAEAVGKRLGMDARQLQDLRFGAVFHDIGKIAVPEQILNKRGPSDRGGAGRDRAPHPRRRADPRPGRVPRRCTVAGAARARALGRPAAIQTGLAGHRHPARLPHHPRLRRTPRDDLRPPLPAGDVRPRRRGANLQANSGTQFDPRVVDGAARRDRRRAQHRRFRYLACSGGPRCRSGRHRAAACRAGASLHGRRRGGVRAVLHPDIAWHVPGTSPIAGSYRGLDEVVSYMLARRALADGTFRMHRLDVLTGSGRPWPS